jgi:hypothetical protein
MICKKRYECQVVSLGPVNSTEPSGMSSARQLVQGRVHERRLAKARAASQLFGVEEKPIWLASRVKFKFKCPKGSLYIGLYRYFSEVLIRFHCELDRRILVLGR